MGTVLLTGATGFLGRQVLGCLLERGHEVHAVSSEPLPQEEARARVHWHRADLLGSEAAGRLVPLVQPTDLVHCAWYSRPGLVWNSLENVRWVEASLRLLCAFGEAGGRRALLVGTCAEYEWAHGFCSEARTPLRPASLYGSSKDALRRVAEAAARPLDVSVVWARPFFLYGPHEHPDRLVPAISRSLLSCAPADCSEGWQLRDYLHVVDAARAIVSLLESGLTGPVNVGSGIPIRVRDVVAALGEAIGRGELIRYGAIPTSPGEAPLVLADVARLRDELGWSPSIELAAGLEEVIDYWRCSLQQPNAETRVRVGRPSAGQGRQDAV